MNAPLTMTFEVACSPEHAFTVWTKRIGTWWPSDHTVSGQPGLTVILEGGVGGRIYERTTDGTEHDWGEVTVWKPPARLSYRWHLGTSDDMATEVDIHFLPQDDDTTRIEIEHRGWERLGPSGEDRRGRNQAGWRAVLPRFLAAVREGAN